MHSPQKHSVFVLIALCLLLFLFLNHLGAQDLRIGGGVYSTAVQSRGFVDHARVKQVAGGDWSIHVDLYDTDYTLAFYYNRSAAPMVIKYGDDLVETDASVHSPTYGVRFEFTDTYLFGGEMHPYLSVGVMHIARGSNIEVSALATDRDRLFKGFENSGIVNPEVTVRGGARKGWHPIIGAGIVTGTKDLFMTESRFFLGVEHRFTRNAQFDVTGPGANPSTGRLRIQGWGITAGLIIGITVFD